MEKKERKTNEDVEGRRTKDKRRRVWEKSDKRGDGERDVMEVWRLFLSLYL